MSRRRTENVEEVPKRFLGKSAAILISLIILIAGMAVVAFLLKNPPESGGINYGNEGNNSSNPVAIMKIKSMDGSIYGTVRIELYRDKAPITVDNFINYSKNGFYDGLAFHRVIPGFVAQGGGFYYGDDGVLTYKQPIYPPIKNEAGNGLSNIEGTIAMARTSDPDSATSQFYFNLEDNTNLDPGNGDPYGYCVFGKVLSGWDIVQSIANIPTQTETVRYPEGDGQMGDVPSIPVIIESITIQGA